MSASDRTNYQTMETRPGDERKVPLTSDKGEGGDDHEILLVLLERLWNFLHFSLWLLLLAKVSRNIKERNGSLIKGDGMSSL